MAVITLRSSSAQSVLSAAWAGHGPGEGASRIYIREIMMNIGKHFVHFNDVLFYFSYVKVYLLPDRSKAGKRKTKVKKHTLNPVFEEILKVC